MSEYRYTIEDLKNGVCAVRNNGTKEDLKKVLKEAFPNDDCPLDCYFPNYRVLSDDFFIGCKHTHQPIQSVKYFLTQIETK